jgi:hypothetical protein
VGLRKVRKVRKGYGSGAFRTSRTFRKGIRKIVAAPAGRRQLKEDRAMSETEVIVSEAGMLKLAMTADTEPGKRVRAEIIAIVMAWKRGRLLPRAEAPMLQTLYGPFDPPLLRVVTKEGLHSDAQAPLP